MSGGRAKVRMRWWSSVGSLGRGDEDGEDLEMVFMVDGVVYFKVCLETRPN